MKREQLSPRYTTELPVLSAPLCQYSDDEVATAG